MVQYFVGSMSAPSDYSKKSSSSGSSSSSSGSSRSSSSSSGSSGSSSSSSGSSGSSSSYRPTVVNAPKVSSSSSGSSYDRSEVAAEMTRIMRERQQQGMGAKAGLFTAGEQAAIRSEVSSRPRSQLSSLPTRGGVPIVTPETPSGMYIGKGWYTGTKEEEIGRAHV